ncbi:hypothetical protein M3J07_003970 [Ascochyta lentis]
MSTRNTRNTNESHTTAGILIPHAVSTPCPTMSSYESEKQDRRFNFMRVFTFGALQYRRLHPSSCILPRRPFRQNPPGRRSRTRNRTPQQQTVQRRRRLGSRGGIIAIIVVGAMALLITALGADLQARRGGALNSVFLTSAVRSHEPSLLRALGLGCTLPRNERLRVVQWARGFDYLGQTGHDDRALNCDTATCEHGWDCPTRGSFALEYVQPPLGCTCSLPSRSRLQNSLCDVDTNIRFFSLNHGTASKQPAIHKQSHCSPSSPPPTHIQNSRLHSPKPTQSSALAPFCDLEEPHVTARTGRRARGLAYQDQAERDAFPLAGAIVISGSEEEGTTGHFPHGWNCLGPI